MRKFPRSLYSLLEYNLNLIISWALQLFMDLSAFHFIYFKNPFFLNSFQSEGRSTKSQTWLFHIDSNSSSIVFLHSSLVGQVKVSLTDIGLASSYCDNMSFLFNLKLLSRNNLFRNFSQYRLFYSIFYKY